MSKKDAKDNKFLTRLVIVQNNIVETEIIVYSTSAICSARLDHLHKDLKIWERKLSFIRIKT